jgi:hypothetical protein
MWCEMERTVAVLLALSVALPLFADGAATGPSSSASPYVVRTMAGVVTKSILTVGDSVNTKSDGTPYRLVGSPDGLGAWDNGDGTFTLLVDHELAAGTGAVRAHGADGAFVSKWIIQKHDLRVLEGSDLIRLVATWNGATGSYRAPATGVSLRRFCSADLPHPSAFYDANRGLGYQGWIFMNGEETGDGRAFAHLIDGTSYELPRLGKFSWENAVARPFSGTKTIVVGLDDANPGQIYVYAGEKTATGSPIERAGLTNGKLFGVKAAGHVSENAAAGITSGTPFSLVDLGNVENLTGAALEAMSTANGVTQFIRPEDGVWDPRNYNDFYFATTATFATFSRLWRLRFTDGANPAAGGTLDMILDGTEGQRMLDNMTMNRHGQLFLQEDPSGQPHLAKIWRYDTDLDRLVAIARHDPERFLPGSAGFLSQDEESSGIIDVSEILGEGWFLADVQVQYATGAETVTGGQIFAMYVPPGKKWMPRAKE